MTPNAKKIIHQVSSFGSRKRGYHKDPIYYIRKTQTTPFDPVYGTAAVYETAQIEIGACDINPFVAKRWNLSVLDDWADFTLITNLELHWSTTDDDLSDEISYMGIRYRILKARHHDVLAYDDFWEYALKRKDAQAGTL